MALLPPGLRKPRNMRRPAEAWWLRMMLGLFLAAFAGMLADAAHLPRPDTAAPTGARTSEIAHLSKREPSRVVVADIRRDGVPASAFDDGGSFLPPPAIGLFPVDASGGVRPAATDQAASTSASAFNPRAPPSVV